MQDTKKNKTKHIIRIMKHLVQPHTREIEVKPAYHTYARVRYLHCMNTYIHMYDTYIRMYEGLSEMKKNEKTTV